MPKFTVLVRAIKHLTRELTIEAANETEARKIVDRTSIGSWDESEPEDFQIESVTPISTFTQLPPAYNDRHQHFRNLNYHSKNQLPAHEMLGKFWKIDDAIYEEFLNILPPQYVPGGFRLIEKLTGTIAATFLRVGTEYWCGYTDRETVEPHRLLNHILREHQT